MLATMLDLAIWAQMPNPGGPPPFGPGGPRFGPGGPPFGPGAGGPPPGSAGVLAGIMICYFLFLALVMTFAIIVWWKIFTKAGEPGWACIIPIYNALVIARICGRPEAFGLVYMIPCVGAILLCFDLAAAFGKDAGFAVGLLLLGIVFLPILAFGDAEHVLSRRPRRRRRPRHVDEGDEDDYDRPRRRPADDDDEEDNRPRRRTARRYDDDDADDDRPRRRPAASDERVRRRPDDEAPPRPRRRPADDEDDEPPPRPRRRRDDD